MQARQEARGREREIVEQTTIDGEVKRLQRHESSNLAKFRQKIKAQQIFLSLSLLSDSLSYPTPCGLHASGSDKTLF